MNSTPLVLIHGGGFDSRCWEPLLDRLDRPALAVDLPGRGRHPAPLGEVDFARCARSVSEDIAAAGFNQVVLVGHSLAGCSLPSIVAELGSRVRGIVFIACTVPEEGRSATDTLDPEVQELVAQSAGTRPDPVVMDGAMASLVLGADLSPDQAAWCAERFVPEAPHLASDPVSLVGLHQSAAPRLWIRTLLDQIVPPAKQRRFANNVGHCPTIDLEAGHMCMVSEPSSLARLLETEIS